MSHDDESMDSRMEMIGAELNRIGLRRSDLHIFVLPRGGFTRFLDHLRSLPAGASWSDVFPGNPPGWTPNTPPPERSYGPFDYPEPPRGAAVFAVIDVPVDPDAAPRAVDLDACARVLAGVGELGIPIYGSGLVLDRGHPHMYVILPLGAPVEHVDIIAEFLRDQAGIGNAYPTRFESGRASDD